MQNQLLQGVGRGDHFPPLMDKPEISFIFQSFPSLKGEKLPNPAQFRTRKWLPSLENFQRGSLLMVWDKLNDNNCFYWVLRYFLAAEYLSVTQGAEGLMHFNPGLTRRGV